MIDLISHLHGKPQFNQYKTGDSNRQKRQAARRVRRNGFNTRSNGWGRRYSPWEPAHNLWKLQRLRIGAHLACNRDPRLGNQFYVVSRPSLASGAALKATGNVTSRILGTPLFSCVDVTKKER
jgi:hypothetical protein